MNTRDEKLKDLIRRIAGDFLQRESNYTSIITVTDIALKDRGRNATILFTVLPESKEKGALGFLKRMRGDFREYFKDHARMRALPFFDFEIDKGEKNRQQIDEIS